MGRLANMIESGFHAVDAAVVIIFVVRPVVNPESFILHHPRW